MSDNPAPSHYKHVDKVAQDCEDLALDILVSRTAAGRKLHEATAIAYDKVHAVARRSLGNRDGWAIDRFTRSAIIRAAERFATRHSDIGERS